MADMNWFSIIALLAALVLPLAAQEASQDAPAGLSPRWEVIEMAKGLENHAADIEQLLQRVRPKEWIQDGAPEAYVSQHGETLSGLRNLILSAQNMARHPQKLTPVVDTFLWLDRLDSMVSSIAAGARKYQGPAVSDLLLAANERSSGRMEQLKIYLRQLAESREAEMEIAHSEAQRCRDELFRQPPRRK